MTEAPQTKPNYRNAEQEAERLLADFGVYIPPVNPVEVAKQLGLSVDFVSFEGESKGVAGLYDPAQDAILVNREEAGVRQTFTVAHELGHHVLHRAWAESSDYRVLWRDPRRQSNDHREREANRFAAALLMPRRMVDRYRDLPVASLAVVFAVSEQVAIYRLNTLYGLRAG